MQAVSASARLFAGVQRRSGRQLDRREALGRNLIRLIWSLIRGTEWSAVAGSNRGRDGDYSEGFVART